MLEMTVLVVVAIIMVSYCLACLMSSPRDSRDSIGLKYEGTYHKAIRYHTKNGKQ